jgi:hypothetical protein
MIQHEMHTHTFLLFFVSFVSFVSFRFTGRTPPAPHTRAQPQIGDHPA